MDSGGASANGEGGKCTGQQGSGTVVQHEKADCVGNRLQEGVAGGVGWGLIPGENTRSFAN